ncbi:hypothetical protein CDD83_3301 [Cordyceps sp. RAO-2017]|nr:hypothetical protein CDD83_3301 [Cordyceps sp. RAO-2017]
MAYSATLAHQRGLLSADDHLRLLRLFSRAGLAMDHADFDAALLERATAAILKTRDGKLRAAVPVSPMGRCVFLNDVSQRDMCAALEEHKRLMAQFPRAGEGLDAFVDASDTGYSLQGVPVELELANGTANGNANGTANGTANGSNGHDDAALLLSSATIVDKAGRAAPKVAVAAVDGNGVA